MIHDDSLPTPLGGSAEVAMKGHTMVLYRAPVRAEPIASAETVVWRPGASPIHKV